MIKLRNILIAFFLIISEIAISDGYKVPQYAYGLTACDIDNDGDIDLIVGSNNQGNDTICIMINDGFGKFSITQLARSNYSKVFCSFINDDDLPDIATLSAIDSAWIYYPGLGNGQYGESQEIYKSITEKLYMCNLDADNSPDFISHDWGITGAFGVLYNNGSGIFTHYDVYSSDTPVVEPDVGDLNGDGLNDILTSDYGEGVLIFYNQGYDNFNKQLFDINPVSFTYIFDIDNNGNNDLGLYEHEYFPGGTCRLKIYENQSNNFILTDTIIFPTGTLFREFADFNNDNYFDIAYVRSIWREPLDTLYIVFNNHDLTFSAPDKYYVPNQGVLDVISADFDNNGFNDLAFTYYNSDDTVTVLFNDGTGKFQSNPLTNIKSHDEKQISISVYPNPFNSICRISLHAKTEITMRIKISISDLNGRIVKDFSEADVDKTGNQYQVIWDGRDNAGRVIPAGIYVVEFYMKNSCIASRKIVKY